MVSLIYLQHFDRNIFIMHMVCISPVVKMMQTKQVCGYLSYYSQGCAWVGAVRVVCVGGSLRRRSTLDARCHWLQSGSSLSRLPHSPNIWEQRVGRSHCSSMVFRLSPGNLENIDAKLKCVLNITLILRQINSQTSHPLAQTSLHSVCRRNAPGAKSGPELSQCSSTKTIKLHITSLFYFLQGILKVVSSHLFKFEETQKCGPWATWGGSLGILH